MEIVLATVRAFFIPLRAPSFFFNFAVGSVLAYLFYFLCESIWQRTPGKFITRTKVVNMTGGKPGLGAIALRSLIRFVPFKEASFVGRRSPIGWHDRWSHTVVVPGDYTEEDVQRIETGLHQSPAWIAAIVVCGLIGVGLVSSLLLFSLNSAREKGRDAMRLADMKYLQLGLELYHDNNARYPDTLDALSPKYLATESFPEGAVPVDPVSRAYYHYYSCTPGSYHLAASIERADNPVLQQGTHRQPMCPEDPIRGLQDAPCTDGDVGGYCYDIVGIAR